MVEVTKIRSEIFSSNVYIITTSNKKEAYLIDCGAYKNVLKELNVDCRVLGILLTHFHYDHIYYLSKWQELFPQVKIFGSRITYEGLANAKRNLSFYHENPVEITAVNYFILNEGDKLNLFDDIFVNVLETEGHCEGSLSFIVKNYVFTGDALIPNVPIVTRLKTGNKIKAKASIDKIKTSISSDSLICPGHLEIINFLGVNWNMYESLAT